MIVVAGRINLDTVVELSTKLVLGGKALAKRVIRVFGGSGLNAAIALKRVLPEEEVALVGCVGSDWEGREALDLLRREGVSTIFVSVLEGSTGRAFVIVDPSGESTSITLPGVNYSCVAPEALSEARNVATAVAMNPPPEVFRAILELCTRCGAPLFCDFGTELPKLLPMLESSRYRNAVLVPTLHEIESIDRGVELSRRLGIPVVIKAGSSGAIIVDPGTRKLYRVPRLDPRALGLEPRSSSGCGDTFTATLAAYASRGYSLVEAAARAIVAAAIKASRLEPYAAPYRSELEEAFAKVGRSILSSVSVESI